MTIKELLGKSGKELSLMTDEELNVILSPYFKFARPEQGKLKLGELSGSTGPIKRNPRVTSTKLNLNKNAYTEIERMLKAKAEQLGIKL